jgi:hypothetical protein
MSKIVRIAADGVLIVLKENGHIFTRQHEPETDEFWWAELFPGVPDAADKIVDLSATELGLFVLTESGRIYEHIGSPPRPRWKEVPLTGVTGGSDGSPFQ